MKFAKPSPVDSRFVALAVLGALVLPLYYARFGYAGDDYTFHLSSWLGILADWHSGLVYPSWIATANFNLGEPRFLYYPPVSLLVGSLMMAIFPQRIVPGLFASCILLLSAFSMRRLAREILPARAVASGLLYGSSFYLLLTLLVRYAIAEALVQAFLPLIILFYLRLLMEKRIFDYKLPLILALAWLTNVPASIVVFYVLLLTTLVWCIRQRSIQHLLGYGIAQLSAICLSAWYILPVMLSRGELNPGGIQGKFHWQDYTLFHTPQGGLARMLAQPLWLWSLAGAAIVLYLLWKGCLRQEAGAKLTPQLQLVAIMSCVPLLFQLPQSGILWTDLPQIQLVQFSFRFLCFLCIGLSLFVPQLAVRKRARAFAYTVWIVFALLPIAHRATRKIAPQPEMAFSERKAQMESGSIGIDQYLPKGLDTLPSPTSYEPVSVSSQQTQTCHAHVLKWKPQDRQIEVNDSGPCNYVLGILLFPEWHSSIDGVPTELSRFADGRAQLLVPTGVHQVTLTFERPARPLLVGCLVSLIALLSLFFLRTRQTRAALEL